MSVANIITHVLTGIDYFDFLTLHNKHWGRSVLHRENVACFINGKVSLELDLGVELPAIERQRICLVFDHSFKDDLFAIAAVSETEHGETRVIAGVVKHIVTEGEVDQAIATEKVSELAKSKPSSKNMLASAMNFDIVHTDTLSGNNRIHSGADILTSLQGMFPAGIDLSGKFKEDKPSPLKDWVEKGLNFNELEGWVVEDDEDDVGSYNDVIDKQRIADDIYRDNDLSINIAIPSGYRVTNFSIYYISVLFNQESEFQESVVKIKRALKSKTGLAEVLKEGISSGIIKTYGVGNYLDQSIKMMELSLIHLEDDDDE